MRRKKGTLFLLIWVLSLLLVVIPETGTAPAIRITTIAPPVIDASIRSSETNTYYWMGVFKFDLSNIGATETIAQAIFKFYIYDTGTACDGDMRFWNMNNQTWTQGTPPDQIITISTTNQTDYDSGYTGRHLNKWYEADVTDIVKFDHDQGNTNCSIRAEDPDYLFTQNDGLLWTQVINIGYWNPDTGFSDDTIQQVKDQVYGEATQARLNLYLEGPGPVKVTYDFPTFASVISYIPLEQFWNGTQLLYRFFLHPYEDLANVTLDQLSITYTFAGIAPNASDWTDTISSDGKIIFYDLYEGTYEVYFDPSQDWHTLHIMTYNPDQLGLKWEDFKFYLNDTRVPYPPEHLILTGYYEYSVTDYFTQTVLTGSFTIQTSDPEHKHIDLEISIYEVAFHNGDVVPYRVEITRNSLTREYPAPPKGDVTARLYGLAANVPYTVEVYNDENDQLMDSYTLNVPDHPIARALEYDNDERVDFPSYKWIQDSFKTIQGQLVSTNQLVLLIGIGLFATILVQTQGILKNLLNKPLVKRGKPK